MSTDPFLMFPLCVDSSNKADSGEHWMLFVADVKERETYILNSLPSVKYQKAADKYITDWQ